MENAVTKSDKLSGIDENVCILHDNTQNVFLGIDEKYETLSIYVTDLPYEIFNGSKNIKLLTPCSNDLK